MNYQAHGYHADCEASPTEVSWKGVLEVLAEG